LGRGWPNGLHAWHRKGKTKNKCSPGSSGVLHSLLCLLNSLGLRLALAATGGGQSNSSRPDEGTKREVLVLNGTAKDYALERAKRRIRRHKSVRRTRPQVW
jgi:hypothetical protein